MSAIVPKEDAAVSIQQPVSISAATLAMIERAARDPAVDVVKMKALMDMHQAIRAEQARDAFQAAMRTAQGEMRNVVPDLKNASTSSRYASFGAVDAIVRPVYSRHGFSIGFTTAQADAPESVRIIATVSHEGGHSESYHIDMPADGKGAKGGDVMTKTHATGSAVTYGRRYLIVMIFNVSVADDDGNAASGTITEEQIRTLSKKMVDTRANLTRFLKHFKIAKLEDLPIVKYGVADKLLDQKAK